MSYNISTIEVLSGELRATGATIRRLYGASHQELAEVNPFEGSGFRVLNLVDDTEYVDGSQK